MSKYILIITALILFFIGCSKNPVDNPVNYNPSNCTYPPGQRNYIWQMDTVAWFPSSLGGVWAFSDSDAYVMGCIVNSTPPLTISLALHWNGKNWDNNINGNYSNMYHYSNDVTGDDHYLVSVGFWDINNPKAALAEFDNRTKKWKGFQFQTAGSLTSVWTDGNGYFIAVGSNGMIYQKDGYQAEWVYSKSPEVLYMQEVVGISKDELYFLGQYRADPANYFPQIWRYAEKKWTKLLDDFDTTSTYLKVPNDSRSINQIASYRCSITDSLKFYVMGWESYLFESKGLSNEFKSTNLSSIGLPLRNMRQTATKINEFSPNDIWIFGSRFNFYHYNGNDFQRMDIPGLPNNNIDFGMQLKMIKTSSGRIFLPTEVSSQVYVVIQGYIN